MDESQPCAGARSDVPQPRARTPSPVRLVAESSGTKRPEGLRDFAMNPNEIDVIYAEDEEVFRETAIREILKVGFDRSRIYEAENGLEALEHLARLQTEGDLSKPLLVLLDVRMPGMDGRECALQIQELAKKHLLRREPFVMCISSIHRQVIVDEGKGNFQVVLPKPFNTKFLDEAMELFRQWWTMGLGRRLPAWKSFEPSMLEVITADQEPVCRMAAIAAFQQAGVCPDSIGEAEDDSELIQLVKEAQEGDVNKPLVVILGSAGWAKQIRSYVETDKDAIKRNPFVISTAMDGERAGARSHVDMVDAFLPKTFKQADMQWLLEYCRLWWLTRGGGDTNESDASSEDSASVMSEES
mmetsp:Transcript_31528/g.80405  ORF Transcript_31528/g.80405 Transcript_31528/m.80405 type:complete len:356 (+) Transcript_31528:111-1178(+)|eukprot:CAMPEP_0195103548 /NCGR_PEP_ID=MMETSP0448-20130528/72580_1 /TAXON_ID=66468 /ORGANISM="Heterocapsa triquestra, Strain CCMP 448" /LENGTH=355 /DNA_ID=CAMNT_0040139255 /DNA_START=110 /DNA_END=1177 /DNA_ORIENTATION=-